MELKISNEHIRNTYPNIKNIYLKVLDVFTNTDIIKESWKIGIINTVYKHKCDSTNTDNYRPITEVAE